MRYIDTVVVHCSATRDDQYITAEDIRRWHVDGNGWSDIGYHYVITRAGEIQTGRPIDRAGAHAKGHNETSIGICLVGGLDQNDEPQDNFRAAQKTMLRMLLQQLKSEHPTINRICGHRDLSPDVNHDGVITPDEWLKACPCFDVADYLTEFGIEA